VDFIGDAVLVAHNAPFDMGFIKRDIKEYLNIDLENSVIDTLQMARDLFPDFKKYGLGDLNKSLGLALEKHHRAVDDSQATANMFIIFLEKYKDKVKENKNAAETEIKWVKDSKSCFEAVECTITPADIQKMVAQSSTGKVDNTDAKEVKKAVAAAVEALKNNAIPVANKEAIAQVAAVSSRSEKVGEYISEAMEKVGKDGVITIEESRGMETELEVVEGMQFDRGYLSPYMVSDTEKMIKMQV